MSTTLGSSGKDRSSLWSKEHSKYIFIIIIARDLKVHNIRKWINNYI